LPTLVVGAFQLIVAAAFAAVAATLAGAAGGGVLWSWWHALAMSEKANAKSSPFAFCSTCRMYARAPDYERFPMRLIFSSLQRLQDALVHKFDNNPAG
jgi:hypothetical protein